MDQSLRGLEPTGSDAQLAHFLVVVLAVENLPLLRAFEDNLALRSNLLAGSGVDARLFGKQGFESLARFLADGVAVFEETNLVGLGEGVGHSVRELVELVAADPHSTALYFRANSV